MGTRVAVSDADGHSPARTVIELPVTVASRISFAQLYGMCDALTDHIARSTRSSVPIVDKYIPYGALSEVMPYLGRRAIENKSVLGNGATNIERKRAGEEIWKCVRSWTPW